MTDKTRKRIWQGSLVMSVAIVGVLAAFIVLANNPGSTAAHGGSVTNHCDDRATEGTSFQQSGRDQHDKDAAASANPHTCADGSGNPDDTDMDMDAMKSASPLLSSSETSSDAVKLTLTIVLEQNLTGSSWVEIYLEDDYQEPGSIAKENVVFEAQRDPTIDGSEVDVDTTFAAAAVEIDDGGTILNPDEDVDDDEDVVVISARIPDMKDGDATGYPKAGQTLIMVVSTDAGIKNPSESGSHSVGYSIIGGTDDRADKADMKLDDLKTLAEISLSADDGGRGKEVTIIGSGFNNDTTATVYLLTMENGATSGMSCPALLDDGDKVSLGTAEVGSDDNFSVVFTVSNDDFDKGEVNYICARDDDAPDNRTADAVKTFDMTPSLSVSPDSANSGEEVTLKPRDFDGDVITVSLDGTETATFDGSTDPPTTTGDFTLMKDGTSDYTFDMPGGLSGTVQVSFNQGDDTKRTTIVVDPSNLELSKAEVAPNETVIISGSGFSEGKTINVKDIELDGKSMVVDNAGTQACGEDLKDLCVKTTSSGEFTATVSVWAMGDNNPALDDDTYTIKVTDSEGFVGKAKITILEPTVSVMPEMVSPRDFITISGENWPISSADDDHEVKIMVDRRNRSVNIDGNGRFRYQYQLRSNIGIGDEHEVVVEFTGDGGSIEEEVTFEVHDADIMLTPTEAAPGQTISLEIDGMPPYTLVDHVNIDGVNRLGGQNLNTDRHGNVMITGVLVPYLDPGFYPVEVMVGEETRVVQLEVLSEAVVAGVAAALPGAVEDLGDNLVRIFHFNTSSKVWTFYDPRPEFEGLSTLTELAAGQPYWILVPETQENVVLNGRTRNLTCVGGDCWNQLIW